MFREREGWFVPKDGAKLFEKTWEPTTSPTAHIVFLHGFNDRSELQYTLFPTLASQPYSIAVHAIDQRGWGKSVHHPSQKGLTGPTTQVLADVDEYIGFVHSQTQSPNPAPIFLMGHSMGGQILLHYLLTPYTTVQLNHRSKISAAILASPYISLHRSSQPWRITVALGRLAAKLSPRTQMKQNLEWRYISRNLQVGREWRDDVLCHGYGTLEGLSGMLDRGAVLEQLGVDAAAVTNDKVLESDLPCPVFWAHGTADRVTEFGSSKNLFERLAGTDNAGADNDKSGKGTGLTVFKPYVNAYHKIHAEPDGVGVAFARDVGTWCLRVVDASKQDEMNDSTTEAAVGDEDRHVGIDQNLASELHVWDPEVAFVSVIRPGPNLGPESVGRQPGRDGEEFDRDKVKAKL